MIRLAVLAVLALAGPAFARTEASPPPKVHIVAGKVRSLETLTINGPYQLLIVDIPGEAKPASAPTYADVVAFDAKASCKVAWAFHKGGDLVAKPGDIVGPFAIRPCLEKDERSDGGPKWAQMYPSILPVTLGSVALESYVPSSFDRVKEGDAVALKALRRLIEVFGTHYTAPFHGAVTYALVDIRTLDALRFGIEIGASTVYQSVMWRFTPGSYEAMEPFVIAHITGDVFKNLDLLEALWQLSPKRARALVQRMLPMHAKRMALFARPVADTVIYDMLIAHYRASKVDKDKAAILDELTTAYATIPHDDYLEPFLTSVGGAAVAAPLATMAERRKHKLSTPTGLLAYMEKFQYKYDQYKLIRGTRLAWRVRLADNHAVEPVNNILIEFKPDAETVLPLKSPWVLVEGVVTDASTSSSPHKLRVTLRFPRFTPVP